MPKATLTYRDVDFINHARQIRQHHRPTGRLRKTCAACGQRWGRQGCALHLWATDYLSQFSVILIPDRPPRPQHRHRPDYIAKLHEATEHIRQRLRTHARPRPA